MCDFSQVKRVKNVAIAHPLNSEYLLVSIEIQLVYAGTLKLSNIRETNFYVHNPN